jgi:hypothetical protein
MAAVHEGMVYDDKSEVSQMAYLLVRHSVEDYNEWKPAFDQRAMSREAAGCKAERIFRDVEKPNEVTVLLECDTLEHARTYAHSEDIHEGIRRRGIRRQPDVSYLEEADRPQM